jgi:hypothetical protein
VTTLHTPHDVDLAAGATDERLTAIEARLDVLLA